MIKLAAICCMAVFGAIYVVDRAKGCVAEGAAGERRAALLGPEEKIARALGPEGHAVHLFLQGVDRSTPVIYVAPFEIEAVNVYCRLGHLAYPRPWRSIILGVNAPDEFSRTVQGAAIVIEYEPGSDRFVEKSGARLVLENRVFRVWRKG